MNIRIIPSIILLFLLLPLTTAQADDTAKTEHLIAIHVDDNDAGKMNLALNNAENISQYYKEKGEDVAIEIVTYGPGLNMLRADTSPVKERIGHMSMSIDNLTFAACGNIQRKMAEKEGKDIEILPEATVVPSGVVRLMELQEQGLSYVRP